MLRGDNIICGTTSTGTTSPLVLAATPVPPGGIDFDVFARATGIGFGNSAAIIVSYTIIEYTDSTFSTAKATEKSLGTLTLGGSAGIANASLTRGVGGFQTTATSLNAQPATQNIVPATAYSIVTAANTLVFIGPSVLDLLAAVPPYVETGGGQMGYIPLSIGGSAFSGATNGGATNGQDYYTAFYWPTTILAKKLTVQVQNAYTGGSSNIWGRIYAIGSNGRPGKLLIDFGLLGTAGSSLASAGAVASAVSTNGYLITPGGYILCISTAFSGGSGSPNLYGASSFVNPGFFGGSLNVNNAFVGQVNAKASSSGGATPSDPANVTSYALDGSAIPVAFTLNTS